MRLIALDVCGAIATLTFLAMVASIARHRTHSPSNTAHGAVAEYLWSSIPWMIIIVCAIPAVRQVWVSTHEPFESQALFSSVAVVINERPTPESVP